MLKSRGFTLVEIMIVVAIIGILAAIAIPNFMKARESGKTAICHATAKQLQGALDTAAVSSTNNLSTSDLEEADIDAIACPDYIKSTPKCPSGGSYYTDEKGNVMCDVHQSYISQNGGSVGITHAIDLGDGNGGGDSNGDGDGDGTPN